MPQISVIVPVYNVEKYIHRCVDSILAQTFTDFELILVDDGSPDNCGAICDEYAAQDARVRVFHQENGGLSAARNAGIDWAFAHSDSEWLSFIDSDDWVHPEFLEYLERAVRECNVSVSACRFERVEAYAPPRSEEYSVEHLTWDDFYLQDPVAGAIAWNKLYAKKLFQDLRYPVGKCHEDEFLTYKVLYRAGEVASIPLSLYMYYQNPEGIMKQPFKLARLDGIEALKEQCAFALDIDNKLFYFNRLKSYRANLACRLSDMSTAESIPAVQKSQYISSLRKELRSLLFPHRTDVPFKSNEWLYEAAYPKLMNVYWISKGVEGKIKRMVNRNAHD